MARKKKDLSFAGEVASAVQQVVTDALSQLNEQIEAAVQDAVNRQFGLPTGDDLVEQHVSRLVSEHKTNKSPGKKRVGRPKGSTNKTASAKPAKKRAGRKKAAASSEPASAEAAPKKKRGRPRKVKAETSQVSAPAAPTNGAAGSTYEAMRKKVMEQKSQTVAAA